MWRQVFSYPGDANDVEIDQMSDEELDQFANDHPDLGWPIAKQLAKWVRENIHSAETIELTYKVEEGGVSRLMRFTGQGTLRN